MKKTSYTLPENMVNWIRSKLNDKQFLIFSSILVGITAGIAAVILKSFVHFIRLYAVDGYLNLFEFKYTYVFLPLIGIGITIFIIKRFYNNILSKGISFILNAIAKKSSFLPFHHMWAHIITSGVTVGFGGSVGLESPIVNTGAAIGSNYSRRYHLNYRERTLLLAAGAAGGISGAFNAPIAGVLFALEVLLIDINLSAFIPLLIASASGALVSKIILKENILLYFKLQQPFNYHNLPYYLLLGFLAGLISLYYVNTFSFTENLFRKNKSKLVKWLLGGGILIILIAIFPSLFGEGYESIKSLSELKIKDVYKDSVISSLIKSKWEMLLFLTGALFIKSFASALTVGAGGNGGNFAPSLFVGAHLGFTFSYFLQLIGLNSIPLVNITLVAMAGVLSGVFHAPLTAIFLIAEITGGYELIIPLMLVSAISYVVVKYFHPESIDVQKLKKKGTFISEDKDTSILGKIDVNKLIEKDFSVIEPEDLLGTIVDRIKNSKRSIFPVVDHNGRLLGIITMSNIKEELFNQELYDKVIAKELMYTPEFVINSNDDIFTIMKRFEESGQWNLPFIESGKYKGFLSKSSILNEYRDKMLNSI